MSIGIKANKKRGNPHDLVANIMDCNISQERVWTPVSLLHSFSDVGEKYEPLIPQAIG